MVLKKKCAISKKKTLKKKAARKCKVRKPKARKVKVTPQPKEKTIGIVTHYFPKVRAGVIKLKVPLSIGDAIKIKGHTTDFTQTVTSMQIDHVPINKAKKAQEIGLLVDSRVRRNDIVYKP